MDKDLRRKLRKKVKKVIKKKRVKKKRKRLPKRLLIIPNADKKFYERWRPKRDPLDIIHPFRACMMGKPHVGKTMCIKNILLRCDPPFNRIIVIHGLGESTREYDDIQAEMICSEIPPMEFFQEVDCKTLVILDDINFKSLSKEDSHVLNRLYGTLSSHKQISVINATQDMFQLPPIVRRCSNFFVLWEPMESDGLSNMARKVGMKVDHLNNLFKTFCQKDKDHDSVWIDKTHNTPFPLRINGYDLVTLGDNGYELINGKKTLKII